MVQRRLVLSAGGTRSTITTRSSSLALRSRRLRGPPQGLMVLVPVAGAERP